MKKFPFILSTHIIQLSVHDRPELNLQQRSKRVALYG